MKNSAILSTAIFATTLVCTIACVPAKKFKDAQSKIDRLNRDSTSTHAYLDKCNANIKELENDKKLLQNDKTNLQNEKEDLKYEKSDLINENSNIKTDLDNLSTSSTLTIADQEKRLKNLQNLIQSQKATLNNLKKSIGDALINYKADELSVYVKEGNLYVSLEEKLLFKSGSAVVDPKGKSALAKLAEVIKNTKDITVMIEGHTDNVPIKSKNFTNNWELSTARALSIVQILTKDYGFDARHIIASGRGEFYPIKTNNTDAGKARNRRTEIILTPNLTDLYKLLN